MQRLFTVVACVSLAGCATLVHGRKQEVAVSSEPPGAQVLLRGEAIGTTPTKVKLPRRDSHLTLRFEKDGYQTAELPLKRRVSGWIAGDLAWGPLQFANQGLESTSQQATAAVIVPAIFLGVDLLTGGAYKLPSQVQVVLKPLK
jgi:PEGA domain-containing protein